MANPKGNPQNLKKLEPGTERTKEIATKGGYSVSVKTILKKCLKEKIDLTPQEKERAEKLLGRKLTEEDYNHRTLMIAGLLTRAKRSDASFVLASELAGDLMPNETSQLPAININIGFKDPKQEK